MNIRLPLIFLTVISLSFSAGKVQGAGKIKLRLLACEISKEPAKVFMETKGSKSEVFDLPSSGLSGPISVSDRSVVLKAPDKDAPLCTITLPAEGDSFAVLLKTEDPAGFVPAVVRLDDDSFKPGEFYFVNHAPKTVVLKLGETELVLEAGNTEKSRPTGSAGNPFYSITMSVRADSDDKIFASARWPVENDNRSLVIFLTAPTGRMIYRTVEE